MRNPILKFTQWFVIILVSIWTLAFIVDKSSRKVPTKIKQWKNLDKSKPAYLIRDYDYNTGIVTYYTEEDNIDSWEFKGTGKCPYGSRTPSTKASIKKVRLSPLERARINRDYPNGYDIRINQSNHDDRDLQDIVLDSDVDIHELIEYAYD